MLKERLVRRRTQEKPANGVRRVVVAALTVALAVSGAVAAAPAASAAEAPPIPDTVRVDGGWGYREVVMQRPWVESQPRTAALIMQHTPHAVAPLACRALKIMHPDLYRKCTKAVKEGMQQAGVGTLLEAQRKKTCVKMVFRAEIVWNGHFLEDRPDRCLRQVGGSIGVKWMEHGGRGGWLGYATTNEESTPNRPGRYNHFQHGSIYWSPATGAHEVHGAIRQKWASMGWENSLLGFPTSDERATPVKYGRYNTFQNGIIYWSPASGAHEIHGSILEHYRGLGYENSRLGFPTTDEFALPGGGRQQYFQNGCRIEWRPGVPGRGTVAICN